MSRPIVLASLAFLAACKSHDATADAAARETRNEAPAPVAPTDRSTPAKPKPAPRDLRRDAMPPRPQVASNEEPGKADATKAAESTAIPAPARTTRDEAKPDEAKVDAPAQRALEEAAKTIQADIEKLRGEKFLHDVPVKLASKATLVAYLKERSEIETTPERERFKEECAKLLGLIPADMDLKKATHAFLEAQVGGFYDPPTKTFYVMDTFGGDLAKIIMSHEFVHALDDQLYDLDGTAKKLGDDSDQLEAFWSVCEGSGTLTMTQWMFANAAKIDLASMKDLEALTMAGMEDLPPFIWKPALAAYTCGNTFLSQSKPKKSRAKKDEPKQDEAHATDAAAKTETTYSQRLAAAFRDPPRSCEQILHPEKYWDPSKKEEPKRVSFDTTKVPAGWTVLGEDTLGELYLAMVTTPRAERKGLDASNPAALMAMKYTNDAAKGWGGDRVILLGRGNDRLLQLVTVWDTEEDAQEFAAGLQDGDASVLPASFAVDGASAVERDGDVVRITLVRASDRASVPADLAVPWKVE